MNNNPWLKLAAVSFAGIIISFVILLGIQQFSNYQYYSNTAMNGSYNNTSTMNSMMQSNMNSGTSMQSNMNTSMNSNSSSSMNMNSSSSSSSSSGMGMMDDMMSMMGM